MKKTLLLAGALAFALSTTACAPRHVTPKPHKEHVKVIHTKDGRYGYKDDDGFWWWYIIAMNSQSSTTTPAAVTISGSAAPSGLPAGGSWEKGAAPTEAELEGAQELDVELDVMAEGEPATAEQIEAAEAAEAAGEPTSESVDASDGGASDGGGVSDGGSADAGGGGGDAGGGGGDGGGGGGGE